MKQRWLRLQLDPTTVLPCDALRRMGGGRPGVALTIGRARLASAGRSAQEWLSVASDPPQRGRVRRHRSVYSTTRADSATAR